MRTALIALFLSACAEKAPPPERPEDIKAAVAHRLDAWHQAATDADYERYFGTLDSASVFIGTDITENWSKEAFANFSRPYFERGSTWDFTPLERNIYLNELGDVAWFDEVLQTWMGLCRGSGVLTQRDGTWHLQHYVLSVAIPNDDIGPVVKAKFRNDSLYLDEQGVRFELDERFN